MVEIVEVVVGEVVVESVEEDVVDEVEVETVEDEVELVEAVVLVVVRHAKKTLSNVLSIGLAELLRDIGTKSSIFGVRVRIG